MNLSDDDFTLFDLPPRFAQDAVELDARWKDLQRQAHPDNFAASGVAAQRVAMQWSARINEAYRRLRDPLRRAGYLCELRGVPLAAESNTAMPAEFLQQQMEWREALDEAQDCAGLERIARQADAARRQALAALEQTLDHQRDWLAAARQVRALMFVERFASEVQERLDRLEA